MKRIVIYVYPAVSHCNSTFALAKELRKRGHEIVYSGVEELRCAATAQGYEFVPAELTAWGNPLRKARTQRLSFLGRLGRLGPTRRTFAIATQAIKRCDTFAPLVAAARADAFLIDAHYSPEALSLIKHDVPFAIFSTKICLDRQPGIPPISSGLVPDGRCASALLAWWAWERLLAKRRLLHFLYSPRQSVRNIIRHASKNGHFPFSAVSFDRCMAMGLRMAPEFILAPPEFDFPRQLAPNQRYVGPYVDLQRQQSGSDFGYAGRMDRLKRERAEGKPLAYCSLGTLPWQYRDSDGFLQRLLEACRGAPWNLVLALGGDLGAQWRARAVEDVVVFDRVPQLDVLRNCDLMITHGGMNSIKECILVGVPLLVFPGAADLDQEGNAARVIYHRLGRRGHMRSDSSSEIRRKVESVLTEPAYRARVADMQKHVMASHAYLKGPEIVEDAFWGERGPAG